MKKLSTEATTTVLTVLFGLMGQKPTDLMPNGLGTTDAPNGIPEKSSKARSENVLPEHNNGLDKRRL